MKASIVSSEKVVTSAKEESRSAPDAKTAVQVFMDLSTDYLELVPEATSVHLCMTARTTVQREELRDALFAFMLWRKFVTKGEPVYIPGVVDRVLREHGPSIPAPKRKEMRGWAHGVSATIKSGLATNGGVIPTTTAGRSGSRTTPT